MSAAAGGGHHARLAASAARSAQAAAAWRAGLEVAAIEARFAGLTPDDVDAVADRAQALLEDEGWIGPLLAPLIAALRNDPWTEPPLRVNRDALKTGAVLFDNGLVSLTASVIAADRLALLPPPTSLVVPGRLSIVRYVKSGGAMLNLWRAGPAGHDFTAASAAPATPVGALPLADGVVMRLDGRTRGWWLARATADVVMVTATLRAGQAPLMRAYDLPSGAFGTCATLDDGAARAQMLLTLLRVSKRADAGDCFAAATRDAAPFLRWSAMREWLALDARAALVRLRTMAGDDPSDEVRSAAAATLAMVEQRMQGQRCLA